MHFLNPEVLNNTMVMMKPHSIPNLKYSSKINNFSAVGLIFVPTTFVVKAIFVEGMFLYEKPNISSKS